MQLSLPITASAKEDPPIESNELSIAGRVTQACCVPGIYVLSNPAPPRRAHSSLRAQLHLPIPDAQAHLIDPIFELHPGIGTGMEAAGTDISVTAWNPDSQNYRENVFAENPFTDIL